MPVELILSLGSHSGTAAPIHQGYYLIGRHTECQIRPKSRSVSRRHCLLLHNDDGVGIMDLKSTRGTFVNGTRLTPHQWRVLADGDRIRFGKVAFEAVIKLPALVNVGDSLPLRSDTSHSKDEIMVTPPSWQNQDIATFLADEDAAELAERNGTERNGTERNGTERRGTERNGTDHDRSPPDVGRRVAEVVSSSNVNSPSFDSGIDLDREPDPEARQQDTLVGDLPNGDRETEADKPVEVDAVPKRRPPNRRIDPKEYKRAPKRSLSLPGLSLSLGSNADWKLIGSIALVVAVVGLFSFQVYSFRHGSQIQVRQDLD